MHIWKKILIKLEKCLRPGLFCKSQHRRFAGNSAANVLIAALSHDKLARSLTKMWRKICLWNSLYWFIKQPKNQKKVHKISTSLYWVDIIAKNDDEIYVLWRDLFSKFIDTFYLSFLLCQRRSTCESYWKSCSYFDNPYHHAKM